MQKLILPFKKSMMLCGYKNYKYLAYWGYNHFGSDISTIQGGAGTDDNIYGSGNGTVLYTGYDNSVGNTIIAQYDDVYNHSTGATQSLVARYAHLSNINVSAGDIITTDTILGVEGNINTTDYHLHIEFDTDTDYPRYSPQVSSSDDSKTMAQGNIWLSGIDTTVDPSLVFHQTSDRTLVEPTYNPSWLNDTDFTVPVLTETTEESSTTSDNTEDSNAYEERIDFLVSTLSDMTDSYEEAMAELSAAKAELEALQESMSDTSDSERVDNLIALLDNMTNLYEAKELELAEVQSQLTIALDELNTLESNISSNKKPRLSDVDRMRLEKYADAKI